MSGHSRNQTQASQSIVSLCADGAILAHLLCLSEWKIVTSAQMEYCWISYWPDRQILTFISGGAF